MKDKMTAALLILFFCLLLVFGEWLYGDIIKPALTIQKSFRVKSFIRRLN